MDIAGCYNLHDLMNNIVCCKKSVLILIGDGNINLLSMKLYHAVGIANKKISIIPITMYLSPYIEMRICY
jgi:hypothetical protein